MNTNSYTRRIDTLLRIAEDNLTMVHSELKAELYHDSDAPKLIHALHKGMIEAHYSLIAWRQYVELLSRRYQNSDSSVGSSVSRNASST